MTLQQLLRFIKQRTNSLLGSFTRLARILNRRRSVVCTKLVIRQTAMTALLTKKTTGLHVTTRTYTSARGYPIAITATSLNAIHANDAVAHVALDGADRVSMFFRATALTCPCVARYANPVNVPRETMLATSVFARSAHLVTRAAPLYVYAHCTRLIQTSLAQDATALLAHPIGIVITQRASEKPLHFKQESLYFELPSSSQPLTEKTSSSTWASGSYRDGAFSEADWRCLGILLLVVL